MHYCIISHAKQKNIKRSLSMFLLFILYLISTFPLTKALTSFTQPFFLLGFRMAIAGIILLLYTYCYTQAKPKKNHILLYIQAILFAVFLPYALRYYGLQCATSSCSPLIYSLGPVITYLLTHIMGIEKITLRRSVAIGISFIGLLLTLNSSLSYSLFTSFGLPDCALLLSLICFSYGWIIMRKLIIQYNYHPALINGIAMLGGGILGLGASAALETYPYVTDIPLFVQLLPLIIIFSNLIAHNLYAILLRNYSLTLIQLCYWLVPCIHLLTQAFYTHTLPNTTSLYALLFLGTGFLLLYKQEKTPICAAIRPI